MKHKISLWNAVMVHVAVSCVVGTVLSALATFMTVWAGILLQDSALFNGLYFIGMALTLGAVALTTWLSAKVVRRYEVTEVTAFVNNSSAIILVILFLRVNIPLALLCAAVFYLVTRKAFPAKKAVAPEAPSVL